MGGAPALPEHGLLTRVRSLDVHADYRCGNSGACCSAGWRIPIEDQTHRALLLALERGDLTPPRTPASDAQALFDAPPHLPSGMTAVFAHESDGRCVFLEEGPSPLCAVHRQCGEETLPVACRQFPRLALLRPGGIDVSLSHWCPTALGGLLRSRGSIRVIESPPAFRAEGHWEGLDARRAHPPMLRPDCLLGWEGHDAWEALQVRAFGSALDPFEAWRALASAGERLRRWRPHAGPPLAEVIAEEARRFPQDGEGPSPRSERLLRLHALALGSLPGHLRPEHEGALGPWPPLGWEEHRWMAGRHLASRAFASWVACQGTGIRTTLLHLACTLATLAVKSSRAAASETGSPGESAMRGAIRQTDLMLIHHADPAALTRELGFIESESADWWRELV